MDLLAYTDFVQACTSAESEFLGDLVSRLEELDEDVNISLLLTGAIGLGSESGEFEEIVKKTVFQGKPLDIYHLSRELGDIFWYWTNACRALGLDPYDVIKDNVAKLKARYPDGEFDVAKSENRAFNDL
jgi:NTP pyrophosphatase (non-canonical NTP hydrolase)